MRKTPEAVKRWHARVSGQTLRRILLLGERFTSAEAQQAGVVSHLVDKGSVVRCSRELADTIIQGNQSVISETKRLLVALESGETDLARWEKVRKEILDSPERRESIAKVKKQKN